MMTLPTRPGADIRARLHAMESAIRIGIFSTCIEQGLDEDAAIAIVKGTMAQPCVTAALARAKGVS